MSRRSDMMRCAACFMFDLEVAPTIRTRACLQTFTRHFTATGSRTTRLVSLSTRTSRANFRTGSTDGQPLDGRYDEQDHADGRTGQEKELDQKGRSKGAPRCV